MTIQALTIDDINKMISGIPRLGITKRISWMSSPEIVARLVEFIYDMPGSMNRRVTELSEKIGVSRISLICFMKGKKVGTNDIWPELRTELDKLNVNWQPVAQLEGKATITRSDPPIIRRNTDKVQVMESSGNVIPITPVSPPTAMVAQPGDFAKNTKHSVTQTDVDNDGNFVITTSTVRVVKVGTPEYIVMVKLAFQKKNKAEAV